MSRQVLKLIIVAAILGVSWYFRQPPTGPASPSALPTAGSRPPTAATGDARQTWGHMDTLADHFARHGGDFHARDADDYAAQAAAFLQRAKATGLPAKRDPDGSLRVFDPATGAFGAYNANGTTRTYFKSGSPDYFDRQPGERIDLRTGQ